MVPCGEQDRMVLNIFLTLMVWLFHWTVILPVALLMATPFVIARRIYLRNTSWGGVRDDYLRIVRSFADYWNQGGHGFGG
jgi:Ni,Fe-hydrogenase I cytochrome b subunit